MKLIGKSFIVIGASSGMGADSARAIAREGGAVIVSARRVEKCQALMQEITANGGTANAFAADMRDAAAMQALASFALSKTGRIDGALINAGNSFGVSPFLETKLETFSDAVALNHFGIVYALRALLPPMIEAGNGGSLVVTSARAALRPPPGMAHYAAAKAAAIALCLSVAQEIGRHNIRLNLVSPGFIGTEAWWNMMGEGGKALAARVPLGRIGTGAEIADTVTWLLSDESRYMTGTVLPVDGGMTAG
jgi:NAD(P)-dependent dehydrogenase (short-subunit alcohol dehydrogenase family)